MSIEQLPKTKLFALTYLLFSFSVLGISAYVYQQSSLSISQTIVEIATFTLKDSVLGTINEGQTKTYTKETVPELGEAITLITSSSPVYLLLDSNLETLIDYSTYNIIVKFSQVVGETYTVGDTVCTLTLASPNSSTIALDAAGTWVFDFELSTTANSVSSDTPTTITVTT
ncbi:MAG: hypothetical protein V1850_00975, partial [Candidatus Bathyarchaeota archaeon]